MSANLHIIRAAFREQWRRHGLSGALGCAALGALSTWIGLRNGGEALLVTSVVGLVFVAVPAAAAAGVSRWMGRGPLGLAGSAGRDASTVASYGVGTALWAAPFGLAGLATLLSHTSVDGAAMAFVVLSSLLASAAGFGAAAGRLMQNVGPAILTAWGMVAAAVGLDFAAALLIEQWVPVAWAPVVAAGGLLGLPMVASSTAVWLSGKTRRSPLALGA